MQDRILTKTGSFELSSKESAVRVLHIRGTPSDEAVFGKLFALGEAVGAEGERALRALEAILNEYYNPGTRSRWSRGRSLSIESLFEELLHDANEEWAARNISAGSGLHVVIGLQKDNVMHLASHGSMRALLFRERSGGYLQHFDLLRLREGEGLEDGGLFSNVISGELREGDSVVILSSRFLDRLTLREVEKALTFAPQGGAAFLESQIGEGTSYALGAIILRRLSEVAGASRMRVPVSPHGSVNEMIKTERSTERVLSSQTLPGLREFISSLTMSSPRRNKRQNAYSSRRGGAWRRGLRKFFLTVLRAVTIIIFAWLSFFKFIFRFITNWRGSREKIIGEVKQTGVGFGERTVENFNLLPKRSKSLLFLGLTLLFVFTQSAMFIARKNYRAERDLAWKALYDEISGSRDEIESSLLYGDEEHARALLSEATQNLNLLKKGGRRHEEEVQRLSQLLEQSALRIRHIIVLEDPNSLALLKAGSEAKSLLLFGNKLLAAGNNLFAIERNTKIEEEIALPAEVKDGSIIVSEENNLLAISPLAIGNFSSNGWAVQNFDRKGRLGLGDAMLYGGRLYVLDQETDSIWKYEKTETGFGLEAPWLREPYELQGIASLTIDNALYMLDERGIVRKFYRGREQEFKVTPLEPPYGQESADGSKNEPASTRPGRIRTGLGSKYLYILDPSGKRLVIYTKNGELSAQYTSPKFDDLRDVAFDEKKKEIYILNGDNIFVLLAVHMDQK